MRLARPLLGSGCQLKFSELAPTDPDLPEWLPQGGCSHAYVQISHAQTRLNQSYMGLTFRFPSQELQGVVKSCFDHGSYVPAVQDDAMS